MHCCPNAHYFKAAFNLIMCKNQHVNKLISQNVCDNLLQYQRHNLFVSKLTESENWISKNLFENSFFELVKVNPLC